MTKKPRPRRPVAPKKPKFKDDPFEPPPTGPEPSTRVPPPLIDKPPFDGGDDEK